MSLRKAKKVSLSKPISETIACDGEIVYRRQLVVVDGNQSARKARVNDDEEKREKGRAVLLLSRLSG